MWRCVSRLENTGIVCHNRTVNEETLKSAVIEAINRVLCERDDFIVTLQENIAKVIKGGDALAPEVIDRRLSELQRKLLETAEKNEDYNAIADEILRLRDMRRRSEKESVVNDEKMNRIKELQDFIRSQPTEITEFDETLVKRLISKITVFDERFAVEFKSGTEIEIK